MVALLREIMPLAYLQEQTENNIDRFTGYLRGEAERLEFYVELRAPLERVEPAARAWVFRFIDELEIAEPTDSGCSLDATRRLAAGYAEPVARLSKGKQVESAPSLKSLTRTCREQDFDRWLDLTLSDPAIDSPGVAAPRRGAGRTATALRRRRHPRFPQGGRHSVDWAAD